MTGWLMIGNGTTCVSTACLAVVPRSAYVGALVFVIPMTALPIIDRMQRELDRT